MSTTPPPPGEPLPVPPSILIVGAGVFGLSTALALARDPRFDRTSITVVDRSAFPAADASSIDTSRIVRADYASRPYARLAARALRRWRDTHWGAEGRYTQNGLVLTASGARGAEYVAASLANVRALAAAAAAEEEGKNKEDGGEEKEGEEEEPEIEVLPNPAAIRRALNLPSASSSSSAEDTGLGTAGYLNRSAGWAHAAKAMAHLHRLVQSTHRVTLATGTAAGLLTSGTGATLRVSGARLASGRELRAHTTVLAAGAWTPALLDTSGVLRARGQPLAFYALDAAQAAAWSVPPGARGGGAGQRPTVLDVGTGFFALPPTPLGEDGAEHGGTAAAASAAGGLLKIARHAHGYAAPYPPPPPPGSGLKYHPIPPPALRSAAAFLRRVVPGPDPAPRLSHTRLCFYADTPAADFLVTHRVPHFPGGGLCVAGGGSGHAFKFAPVLGGVVVAVLFGPGDGNGDGGGEGEGEGEGEAWLTEAEAAAWRGRWAWPARPARTEDEWVGDGSRGGERGLVLEEEMRGGTGAGAVVKGTYGEVFRRGRLGTIGERGGGGSKSHC